MVIIWLMMVNNDETVGGFSHLEKYQSMGRSIPYIMDNIMEQENDELVGGIPTPLKK